MKNTMIQGLALNNSVRFMSLNSLELAKYLQAINESNEFATSELSKVVSLSAMMGMMLKGDSKLSINVQTNQEIGKIISTADAHGNVKAMVSNPRPEVATLGNGNVTVVKDLKMKEPFVGSTEIINSKIEDTIMNYFAASEQLLTFVNTDIAWDAGEIKKSEFLIIQVLPEANKAVVEQLFQTLESKLPEFEKVEGEQLLQLIFDQDYKILQASNIQFVCDCGYERFLTSLKMLPVADIIDLKQDKTVEIACQFCHKVYNIETDQL